MVVTVIPSRIPKYSNSFIFWVEMNEQNMKRMSKGKLHLFFSIFFYFGLYLHLHVYYPNSNGFSYLVF